MPSVKAAVMPAPHAAIELREFKEPEIARGGMLLKTIYSEVCGTDVHLWHGRLSGVPYPIIPGHVAVGAIAKMRGPITLAAGLGGTGNLLLNSGKVRTAGNVQLTGAGTISEILQAAAGEIRADALTITSPGSVSLIGANQVSSLTAALSAPSSIQFNNSASTLNLNGITAPGASTITVSNAGSLVNVGAILLGGKVGRPSSLPFGHD